MRDTTLKSFSPVITPLNPTNINKTDLKINLGCFSYWIALVI